MAITQVHRRMIADGGKLVQRVSNEVTTTFSTTTVMPTDNTIPQNTEGVEIITCAITPTSISNKLLIRVSFYISASAALNIVGALFIDSTANALKATALGTVGNADWALCIDKTFEITPSSTSSQTYKFRVGPNTGSVTAYVNRFHTLSPLFNGTGTILMDIMEIGA